MPSIELQDVRKTYPVGVLDALFIVTSALAGRSRGPAHAATRGKVAIAGISLSIQEGERVGIIGRNGAGKSTLVHMIAGLSEPNSGELIVEGHVTSVMTLGVGIKDELTGRENIYLDGELQGRPRVEIDTVLQAIVDFAELGEFIDLPVRTYSTGMKARLGFAMITYMDPEILVIDEALSVGDAAFSMKASARIKEICARGKIVLVVSHDMSSIVDICSRCIWLDDGRIVMDGDPRLVTERYLEEVRYADEQNLLARFKAHSGTTSRDSGVRMEAIQFFQAGAEKPRNIVAAGVNTDIRIAWALERPLREGALDVRLERLDGLAFYGAKAGDEVDTRSTFNTGHHEIRLRMVPLVLGVGCYRLSASLIEAGEEIASAAQIIEVSSHAVPKGGHPALLYPVSVETRSLLK